MKRFIYDALLIVILLLVALSLDESKVYEDKQKSLSRFDAKVEEKQRVPDKEGVRVMNQIEENRASDAAKATSSLLRNIIEGGVRFVQLIFEGISDV